MIFSAVFSFSLAPIANAQFTEEELAETISYDTGYPPEGYAAYVASLVKTLAKLSPGQVEKVFKGKRPKKRDKSGAASTSPTNGTNSFPPTVGTKSNGKDLK